MGDTLVILGILALVCLACWGISKAVYKNRVKAGSDNARRAQIVAFIVSFLVIFGALVLLFLYNISMER